MDALAQYIGYFVLAVVFVAALVAAGVGVMALLGYAIGWVARREQRKS